MFEAFAVGNGGRNGGWYFAGGDGDTQWCELGGVTGASRESKGVINGINTQDTSRASRRIEEEEETKKDEAGSRKKPKEEDADN